MVTKVTKNIKLELTNQTLLKIHREGRFQEYLGLFQKLESGLNFNGIYECLRFLSNCNDSEITDDQLNSLTLDKGLLELQALIIEELGKPIYGVKQAKELADQARGKLNIASKEI